NMVGARTKNAVRTNRLEISGETLEVLKVEIQKTISNFEDVDMAQAILDYQMQQYVYEASLASGGNVILKSLVDFMG
ncbi:flagellar hook-associated protein FlgL, partial [Candidatus Desantisbacteria bacterium]|nr:flagellar hook-associated protein FlgL [Candidatus Desantisbacteria bacterium]